MLLKHWSKSVWETALDNFPSQLSGGEQQRVAIARAVAKIQRFFFVMNQQGSGLSNRKTNPDPPSRNGSQTGNNCYYRDP